MWANIDASLSEGRRLYEAVVLLKRLLETIVRQGGDRVARHTGHVASRDDRVHDGFFGSLHGGFEYRPHGVVGEHAERGEFAGFRLMVNRLGVLGVLG